MKAFVVLVSALVFVSLAKADNTPACMSHGQTLAINNTQVIDWKSASQDQFHSRGHIQGKLLKVYPDQTGHHHLEVQIGSNSSDTIEVIYNEAFGVIPQMNPGSDVEACGDYITTRTSPDGAILHWVHKAPSSGHDSGFLAIDGVTYGQDLSSGGGHHH